MLGKLIKNEFIQTSKSLVAVYGAAAVAIGVMVLSYLTKITWIGTTGSMALIVIGFVAIIMTLVMVVNNFNRSLYGAQGYLSFTLPVRSRDMLFSKFFVSFVWIICSYVVLGACIISIVLYFKSKSDGMLSTVIGMIQGIGGIGELPTSKLLIEALIIVGIGSIITVCSYISFVYFAVTIANTRPCQGHPLLFGLIFFFICYITNKVATSFAQYRIPLSMALVDNKVKLVFASMYDGYEGSLFTYGIAGYIFTAIFAAILLVITGYIMERKVNVK